MLQAVVFGPTHAFHGAQHSMKAGHGQSKDGRDAPVPDDCRCDLCLAFRALDTRSVSLPPLFKLTETAFTVIAAYPSFSYTAPILFSQARGPPAHAVA